MRVGLPRLPASRPVTTYAMSPQPYKCYANIFAKNNNNNNNNILDDYVNHQKKSTIKLD